MYLFFNGVSSQGYIALFSSERDLIASKSFEITGNESTKTIPIIHEFLSQHGKDYADIQNIVTVVGPGSFTGIRTISLVLNSLAYMYPHICLTPVNFFDLYSEYPIVKSSSKRDLFVKKSKSATIEILQNQDFESSYDGEALYGDTELNRFERKYTIKGEIDYQQYFQKVILQNKGSIAPLYIKKPNIS